MWSKCILALCGFAASSIYAQSVSNDIPADEKLTVVFGDGIREIHAPGAQLHPGYLDSAPNISTPAWPSSSDPGLLLMLDLDAPYQDRRVSSLHWLVTNVKPTSSPSPQTPASLTLPPPQVAYQPPQPPIGDIPHTYAFYLIAPVPPSLPLPTSLATNRTPFDLAQFLLDARLENRVVARNHFRVRNLKGTPTAAFPAPRASETAPVLGGGAATPTTSGAAMPTTGSSATFEGGAGTVEIEGRGAWASLTALLLLMALMALGFE